MYGYSELTKLIDRWVFDHLGRHDHPEYAAYLDRVNYWTTIKQAELLRPHGDGRTEFGMSKAGGPTRAAALTALDFEPTPFDAGTRWTFEIGHGMEAPALSLLEMVGCEIVDAQAECVIPGIMRSWSDGVIRLPAELGGETILLSVKSSGYKGSGKQRGKWVRRGFPELPFEGVRGSQPGWWAQCQFELSGNPGQLTKELVFVLAKDTIGSMADDPYLLESGSTFTYCEIIEANLPWVTEIGLPMWRSVAADVKAGAFGDCYVLNKLTLAYAKLEPASNNWEPNATSNGGTYNPCAYCSSFENCAAVTRGVAEQRLSARTSRYGTKTNSNEQTNVD